MRARFERFPATVKGAFIFRGEDPDPHQVVVSGARVTALGPGGSGPMPLAPVTLDVGHLLSYQWLRGRRGEALYGELERLPLAHCVEIHLSGASISRGFFQDFHHGILMDEQLQLLGRLLAACPNLRVVTYEDPRFDESGALLPRTRAGYQRLRRIVAEWAAA